MVPRSVGQPGNTCDNLHYRCHKAIFWPHFPLSHKFDNVLYLFSNPRLVRSSAPTVQLGVSLLLNLSLAKQPLLTFSFLSLGWYEGKLRVVMCLKDSLPKHILRYRIWTFLLNISHLSQIEISSYLVLVLWPNISLFVCIINHFNDLWSIIKVKGVPNKYSLKCLVAHTTARQSP